MPQPSGFTLTGATEYHHGQFPPTGLDYRSLVRPLSAATEALARYDALLRNLLNRELLLAPLRSKEAVVSSRMEGTVATLEEVFKIQADEDEEAAGGAHAEGGRAEAVEVWAYARAMRYAQREMEGGLPICSRLIRLMHGQLLAAGRGADKSPGRFKTDQNYVVDQGKRNVLFVPIEADRLEVGIAALEQYLHSEEEDYLIQTAVSHLEFEALHPFKDGNGRVGRMLVTLNLWDKKKISGPHFYISDFLEENRDEYIERLRSVSAEGDWTGWVRFFLQAIESQANRNIATAERVTHLYEEMKETFRATTASQWSTKTLDYVFEKPVFRSSAFTRSSGVPQQTAHRLAKALVDKGLLSIVEPAAGRRAALYAFMPLLDAVRG